MLGVTTLHPIASYYYPHPHLLVFLLPLGRGHPVARNTFEMGISCSLGQQGLHTASAQDRNSLLRQRGEGQERVGSLLGALWGGVPRSSCLPLLHTNPEEVIKCHGCRGCRGHESSWMLAGCPGAHWPTPASLKPRGRGVRGDRAQGNEHTVSLGCCKPSA